MFNLSLLHFDSCFQSATLRRAVERGRTALLLLAFPLGVASCTTGQIGGEVDADNGEGSNYAGCKVVGRTPLEVDDAEALGFSAEDVMDAVSGVHETTLAWGKSISLSSVSITPEAADTSITVEVRPKVDTAELVDLEPRDSSGESALIGEIGGPACGDEIQFEAEVTVTAENGALSDTFDVVFRASHKNMIHGQVDVVPGQLEGTFDLDVSGSAKAVQTTLHLSFAFGTMSGDLSGFLQQEHGDAVSATPLVYAKFPVDGCDYGSLISAESPWGEAIHGAVEAATEFDFSWDSGEETKLVIEPSLSQLCVEASPNGEASQVAGSASVRVVTDDGRIDGDWQLSLSASVSQGHVTTVQLRYFGTYEQGLSAEEFEAATGISGVESDANDLGFLFDYSLDLADGELAQGSFAIVELIVPDCARPDFEPEVSEEPGGGSGVPGCEGIDLTEIETASFRQVTE